MELTELTLLYFFLSVAFVLAPRMTSVFFLRHSKIYSLAHKVTLAVLLASAVLHLDYVVGIWPLFCAFGFVLFLRQERGSLLSPKGMAACIPFLFSLISATWFFSGVHDLRLLGYNPAWSFYASLHGAFLGWLFVGCLATLARTPGARPLYLWGCYLCLACFLLVAFGIDGTPYIKRIGVVGLSILVPLLIGTYALGLRNKNRAAFALAALSLVSIVATMTLAVLNEFWVAAPRVAFGLPVMVVVHGFMNAVLTIPCFFLAIRLERAQLQPA